MIALGTQSYRSEVGARYPKLWLVSSGESRELKRSMESLKQPWLRKGDYVKQGVGGIRSSLYLKSGVSCSLAAEISG